MPRREYHFWVYILSSRSRNLYTGITNSLPRRTETHRQAIPGTHTGRYAIHRLVYFEFFRYVRSAITREKEIKSWSREQKIALIEKVNPTWEDLYPTLRQPVELSYKEADFRGNDSKKNNSNSNDSDT